MPSKASRRNSSTTGVSCWSAPAGGGPRSTEKPEDPMFPQLAQFTDLGLFLMRLMVGLIFVTSGYSHLKDPTARAKSIGMSKPFTIFLGAAELAGGLGVAFGIFTQLAAFGLML